MRIVSEFFADNRLEILTILLLSGAAFVMILWIKNDKQP